MEKITNPVILLSSPLSEMRGICAQHFKESLSERRQYPLKSGLYKLEETLRTINAFEEELYLLSSKYRGKEPLLGRHTHGDHVSWIKKIPQYVAEEFGGNVLPAIWALTYDGVPRTIINEHAKYFEERIGNLISLCERSRLDIKKPISEEYALWKIRRSKLDDLILRSQWIINELINIANKTRIDRHGHDSYA